jgi:drug/metabolite transporter (DMT)-like permease
LTDLALAVVCGLGIAMIFKYAARQAMDRISLLTANYLTAFLISLAVLDHGRFAPDADFVVLCVLTGSLFIAGFFMLALATAVAGMSIATAVMRISVVIPFVASWAIWSEEPSAYQLVGLSTAAAAFFLISSRPADVRTIAALPADVQTIPRQTAEDQTIPRQQAEDQTIPRQQGEVETIPGSERLKAGAGRRRTLLVLFLLFVVGGLIDTLLKTFGEVFAQIYSRSAFTLMVFGVAAGIGFAIVIGRRHRPAGATIGWGVALGAVNFASVEFILRAITQLSGPFVFPANNILLVIGSTLLGVLFWKERLTARNWIGLTLVAAALILLNF